MNLSCAVCSSTSPSYAMGGQVFCKCIVCGHETALGTARSDFLINDGAPATLDVKPQLLDKFKLSVVLPLSLPGKSLLDFGCSSGSFLLCCKNAGFSVLGIEPSPEPRDCAIRLLGLNVAESIYDLNFTDKQYSVITAWHSLEHVRPAELDAIVCEMASAVAKDGAVVVSVPNRRSITARLFGAKEAFFDPEYHWHQFSLTSLEYIFKKHALSKSDLIFSWPYNFFSSIQSVLNIFFEKNYLYLVFKRKKIKPQKMKIFLNIFLAFAISPLIFLIFIYQVIKQEEQAVLTVVFKKCWQ